MHTSPIIIITPIHLGCCLHSYRSITPRDGYNVSSYRSKGVADKGAYAPKCFTKGVLLTERRYRALGLGYYRDEFCGWNMQGEYGDT